MSEEETTSTQISFFTDVKTTKISTAGVPLDGANSDLFGSLIDWPRWSVHNSESYLTRLHLLLRMALFQSDPYVPVWKIRFSNNMAMMGSNQQPEMSAFCKYQYSDGYYRWTDQYVVDNTAYIIRAKVQCYIIKRIWSASSCALIWF